MTTTRHSSPQLIISQRVVDNVVILDMSGRITIGDGSVLLRDTVKGLLADGKRKILLNFGGVSYVDSSGNGEVVIALSSVERKGGTLKFMRLTAKVRDLWQFTKLFTVFEIYDDESVALRSFEFSRYAVCPSCRNVCTPPSFDKYWSVFERQTCITCNARFDLGCENESSQRVMTVRLFRAETYQQEYFEVVPGPPYEATLVGRLNLFSTSAVDKVWRAVPSPRRVLFNLGSATEIDAPGWEALLAFLDKKESSAKAVIVIRRSNNSLISSFREASYVYSDKQTALAAIGDLSDTPLWLCETIEEIR